MEVAQKKESRDYRIYKVVSPIVEKRLMKNVKMDKYRVIMALMGDLGLRVSEAISLQIKHFNFMENYVEVVSLKKGKDKNGFKINKVRRIPLTEKVNDCLNDYWGQLKDRSMEAYLFPACQPWSLKPHLTRQQVHRYISKKSDGNVYPHMFRHTAATNIVKNNPDNLRVAQQLLGHNSIKTTEIYVHVDDSELRKAMNFTERKSLLVRLYRYFFPKRRVILTPTDQGMTRYHIGRKDELRILGDLMDKKINTYIQGGQGMGKSHLLDNLVGDHILRVDEFVGKQTLGNLLIELFENDKRNIASMIFGQKIEETIEVEKEKWGIEMDKEEAADQYESLDAKKMIEGALNINRTDLTKVVMKNSIKQLTELAIKVTKKDEYTLVVDDVTNITKTGVRILEKLKNHFHIVVAARNIKIDKGTFLTNFQKIELKPLDRGETIKLINLASKKLYPRIEDYEAYKNHIWESTGGNPLYTLEMIDRYSKEADINLSVTKEIRHTAANHDMNMTLPIIICISGLMVLRYYGREAGDDSGAFMLFGGIFMIFALFARPLARLGKRTWV